MAYLSITSDTRTSVFTTAAKLALCPADCDALHIARNILAVVLCGKNSSALYIFPPTQSKAVSRTITLHAGTTNVAQIRACHLFCFMRCSCPLCYQEAI